VIPLVALHRRPLPMMGPLDMATHGEDRGHWGGGRQLWLTTGGASLQQSTARDRTANIGGVAHFAGIIVCASMVLNDTL